jgi:hypothetical protein
VKIEHIKALEAAVIAATEGGVKFCASNAGAVGMTSDEFNVIGNMVWGVMRLKELNGMTKGEDSSGASRP